MKYHVGDKVMVKQNINQHFLYVSETGNVIVRPHSECEQVAGMVVTISSIDANGFYHDREYGMRWVADMLERPN